MVRFPWTALAAGGIALGVIGVLVPALASSSERPQRRAANRVALIGDSYAVGLGPALSKLLPDFAYEGHQGTNTLQWARHSIECGQCGAWLHSFRPDVVLVALGTNDGIPDMSNYQAIVQAIHGIGARVVWIQPPAPVVTPSRTVIASLGVPTVPATRTPLRSDGLHPTSYAPWAQEIAQVVHGA